MTAYKAVLGEDPATSSIQGAIKALQERELIWLASRGDYAFDDESLRQWHLQEHSEPPLCAKPARRINRQAWLGTCHAEINSMRFNAKCAAKGARTPPRQ